MMRLRPIRKRWGGRPATTSIGAADGLPSDLVGAALQVVIRHPDTFDCKAWCSGLGFTKGVCKPVTGPPPCAKSAKCACS